MRGTRLTFALGLVLGLLFLSASAVFAEPAAVDPTAPVTVAKAPPPASPPPKAEAAPAKAPSATPAPGLQVAQLTYPVPPTASGAQLLRAAEEYGACADVVHQEQYLRQVVAAYPGTLEAGRALALLLDLPGLSAEEA